MGLTNVCQISLKTGRKYEYNAIENYIKQYFFKFMKLKIHWDKHIRNM